MKLRRCLLCLLVCLGGCVPQEQEREDQTQMQIIFQQKSWDIILEDNPTSQKLMEMLPLELTMEELNGNEKYIYLDEDLPTHEEDVKEIHQGDLMLFGKNCLVLFYKDFFNRRIY